jgi:peptidoglycan/LPS O-acetylase OafA/YrhL
MLGVSSHRPSCVVLIVVVFWLIDWILFLMARLDPVLLTAPFMFLTLLLLSILMRKAKQTDKRPQPLFQKPTAIMLCLLVVLVFIAGLYYSVVWQLFWNVNALLTLVLAYFVTMKNAGFPQEGGEYW